MDHDLRVSHRLSLRSRIRRTHPVICFSPNEYHPALQRRRKDHLSSTRNSGVDADRRYRSDKLSRRSNQRPVSKLDDLWPACHRRRPFDARAGARHHGEFAAPFCARAERAGRHRFDSDGASNSAVLSHRIRSRSEMFGRSGSGLRASPLYAIDLSGARNGHLLLCCGDRDRGAHAAVAVIDRQTVSDRLRIRKSFWIAAVGAAHNVRSLPVASEDLQRELSHRHSSVVCDGEATPCKREVWPYTRAISNSEARGRFRRLLNSSGLVPWTGGACMDFGCWIARIRDGMVRNLPGVFKRRRGNSFRKGEISRLYRRPGVGALDLDEGSSIRAGQLRTL